VWGRRRILILERLIQLAKKFTVHLLGSGLPSFYIADLGHMNFTLGLSGWTANDWSQSGNFDLMAPRAEVDEFTKRRVFDGLKKRLVRHRRRACPPNSASTAAACSRPSASTRRPAAPSSTSISRSTASAS
jgi:hypothetical protein